jgi:hypothetical protein
MNAKIRSDLPKFWAFLVYFFTRRMWTNSPEPGSMAQLVFFWAPWTSFMVGAPVKI